MNYQCAKNRYIKMNYYVRYFDEETLVHTMDEVIDFLSDIDEIEVTPAMERELHEYAASDVYFPKRYKVRSRVYFIIIKTEARTMQDFKDKKALRPASHKPVDDVLNVEREGWYEATVLFKRVVMNHSGKCEYRDTEFVARLKGKSPIHCYERVIEHLRTRVDSRSQFPSPKGKNFRFKYLGMWK